MTQVTVDSKAVSVKLEGDGSSVTVPSGEVWDVDMVVSGAYLSQNDVATAIEINGSQIVRTASKEPATTSQVLTGGDTVAVVSGAGDRGVIIIGGYEVS
jgi:hypothetical protein